MATKILLFRLDRHVLPKKNGPAVSTAIAFYKIFFLFKQAPIRLLYWVLHFMLDNQ